MANSRIRILHAIPGLRRTGGISVWLRSVMQQADPHRFQFDFLPKIYAGHELGVSIEEEVLQHGGAIHRCPAMRGRIPYGGGLRRVLSRDYRIVHQHNICEGSVLLEAWRANVSHRIAHVHNDVTSSLSKGVLPGRWLRRMQVVLARRFATRGFACSDLVGRNYFGESWGQDRRWELLFYGIDFDRFHLLESRDAIRTDLQIPRDRFVIGNVGRLQSQKNHPFLLRVFAEACRTLPNLHLLLIGDGPDRAAIVRQIDVLGVAARVTLAGARGDVPRLLLGGMDLFFLPSLYEGLPIALLEAQAAGLHCLISNVISNQTDVVPHLIHRLPLSDSAATWAQCLVQLATAPVPPSLRGDALRIMRDSPFSIQQSAKQLLDRYEEMAGHSDVH